MNEVYIVTAGDYSDYHIEAVFKDKTKAEAYCKCHRDCEIEEFDFSDEYIYHTFNYVRIQYDIYIYRNLDDELYFNFGRLTEEDDSWLNENDISITIYDKRHLNIAITRKLPSVYNENKIREKYTKVLYDLESEIKYMLSEQDISSDKRREIAEDNILKAIESKFGIEKE